VVPSGNANVEGNSSMSEVFTNSSFRMQMVFDASQFAIPAGTSGRIDRISFRLDNGTTEGATMFFGGGSITLSLTPVGPDGLSTTFANNVGANRVTIWNGALSFGGSYVSAATPQPFNTVGAPTATAPFWYVPSQGNLLVDIRGRSGQAFFPGALDAESTTGDSVSRVFATSELLTSGSVDTVGLITRFDMTIVPEPSTWSLFVSGALMALLFIKSRRRH
jgi:hypothetical protein